MTKMVDTEYEQDYFTQNPYKPYGDFIPHEDRVQKLIEMFHPHSVLDVGCAYGFIVKRLIDKGIDAWGCDVSKWCQEQAKQVIPSRFVCTPAWDLSFFANKSFDLVYCEGVLEHIPEDKINLTFQEFARVGKRFCLQVAFSEHPNFDIEPGHVCKHSLSWWIDKIPPNSFLAAQDGGSEQVRIWAYKRK